VEFTVEQKAMPVVFSGIGMEHMDMDLQGMFEKILPKSTTRREMTVAEARKVLFEQECENLINDDKVHSKAIELAENMGLIFIDELDKVVAGDSTRGADVSRQGVQRDLLPLVEGSTVSTKHGMIKTDHILFIASGAFHMSKPSDLIPELQGRFPIRVELKSLTTDDFVRILTEPDASLTLQYSALLGTEEVALEFTECGVRRIAEVAYQVNENTENIGARRLHTILERLLEDISFEAADCSGAKITITKDYVEENLAGLAQDEDLSRYIL